MVLHVALTLNNPEHLYISKNWGEMVVIYRYIQEGRFKSVFLSTYNHALKNKDVCITSKKQI